MASPSLRLRPADIEQVRINDRFWSPRIDINRKVTLGVEYDFWKKTGRYDAWKWKPGRPRRPHIFWDSDVAKWLEAAAYTLAVHRDAALERKVERYVTMLERGQMKDGYLNSYYSRVEPRGRWTNLRDCHELYCAGHLIEAAVAYYNATGKRRFLDVMLRCADHIDRRFGPRRGQKRGYPGHQEIELALVKLYRATGEERWLDLAGFFVNERGTQPHYFDIEARARGESRMPSYEGSQAHLPVREQKEAVGHSVRAMYMFSGMADVAAETGDKSLFDACRRLWKNVTDKRMYVTGGIGSSHAGEKFTFDYDLPNEAAYAETCAAIGLVFFAHRMLNIDPHGRYADVMERVLYNGAISGVSLDGKKFFYVNPLSIARVASRNPGDVTQRQEYFGCSCCPPNIARLLASLGSYMYSTCAKSVWVHLYGTGSFEARPGGQAVRISQRTDYPWKDTIRFRVSPEQPVPLTLALRIPGWCRGARLSVNGKKVNPGSVLRRGYARIRRTWRKNDRVELVLPMPAERIEANPNVRQNCGRVALQRGPVVYCLEETDNGPRLDNIVLPGRSSLQVRKGPAELGGAPVITAGALRQNENGWTGRLYRSASSRMDRIRITAVPYAFWANRKPGDMLVWIRECR